MNHHLKRLKFTQVFLDTVIQKLHIEFKFVLLNGNSIGTNMDQREVQTTDYEWVYSAAW
jgi:hypothetical protein